MMKRAFTFVEIMFVVLIMGFVSVGMYQFIVDSSKVLFVSTEKNDIVSNIRQFSGEMHSVAKSANVAYVYSTFNLADRNAANDRLNDGLSGNCVIFISLQADANPLNPDLITKIVGYFLTPDATGAGALKKFTLTYPGGVNSVTNTPESLMAGISPTSSTNKDVIQMVQGLSSGKLFYNYRDRSVMVKARFIQGNNSKRVTSAYNFTISPRG